MNLIDEKNYQMRQEVLDVMGLSEENRKLAEAYLDVEQPENSGLLDQMSHQDFSELAGEARKKCSSYVDHLDRRSRTEELTRYVRFCAAVGGSTARYTLFPEWTSNAKLLECLPSEQVIAIRAEMMVWKTHLLKLKGVDLRGLSDLCRQNLPDCRKAMDCCHHHSENAKTLLAGIYLRHTKEDATETVKFLEDCLIASTSAMFSDAKEPTDEEEEILKKFLHEAKPDAPFTEEVRMIMDRGVPTHDYLTRLLAGVAFMAIEHSDRFLLFLRFSLYMNLRATLESCRDMCGIEWFEDHLKLLERALPVKPEDYGCWCVINRVVGPIQRIACYDEATVKRMLPELNTKEYEFLLETVSEVNVSLYEALSADFETEYRNRMAADMTEGYPYGGTEARDYLLGTGSLEGLYPFIDQWREQYWRYGNYDNYDRMEKMRDDGDTDMFQRALVLEALGSRTWFFKSKQVFPLSVRKADYRLNTIDEMQVSAMLDIFGKEELPVAYQMEILEHIYDSLSDGPGGDIFLGECVKALSKKKSEWAGVFMDNARKGSVSMRILCIRVLDVFWSEYREMLLSCAADSSKVVREHLVKIYAGHREWEQEILSMLSSKKSQEREQAACVLREWGVDAYREQLMKAFEAEKSKKLKELIGALLGKETGADAADQPGEAGEKTADQLAAELLKGGRKRKVEWASEVLSSPVHRTDGTETPTEYLQALMVAYADMSTPGVNADAARLAAELDPKELADLMGLLFGKWVETGAEAKKKWVLYAVSIHGGDAIVPILHHQIQIWPEASRGAIAAEGVRALALNGSSTALLLVDQISRKFKNRQVKAAASDALTYAAEQLGITRMELEDRIVPSLDFDARGERRFDYGTRSFLVRLTPTLELEIFDGNGKKLKNMPAPGKQDDGERAKASNEAFKLMKKQLKTVVTNQKLRLEQALLAERLWPVEKWQELFVKNPIMHQFAIGLIWGVYEQGTQEDAAEAGRGITLIDTFRYMEDGTFNTVDEEEYELPEHAQIGLVHPVELSAETLSAWKEQLSDYEVTQPFEQLERPVYHITEEEKKEKELSRFGGMLLNGLSLSGKLLGQGWYRGAVEDAGFFFTFYRNDGANGVELEFSGVSVGFEGEEVTVYGVYFYPSGEAAQGSYRYQKDYEKKRCLLSEVSPRYFSEIVLLMTRATASSDERLPYPECKDQR